MNYDNLFKHWVLFSEDKGSRKYIPVMNKSVNPMNDTTLDIRREGDFVEVIKNNTTHGHFNLEKDLLYLHYKDTYRDRIFAITSLAENELILAER
jgi:hypothetical protein